MICKAVQVILRVQWGQETCLRVIGGRWGGAGGPRGSRGTSRGSHGAIRLVWWVFRWFMGHISLYICDPNFSCGLTDGRTDGLTEVFHEALADLKNAHFQARPKNTFQDDLCTSFVHLETDWKKVWSRLSAHFQTFFRLIAHISKFCDKKYRTLTVCDKKHPFLVFEPKQGCIWLLCNKIILSQAEYLRQATFW